MSHDTSQPLGIAPRLAGLVVGLAFVCPDILAQPVGDSAAVPATTFPTVWFRGENKPSAFKAFEASGELRLDGSAVVFDSGKVQLRIPVETIRWVRLDQMKGDSFNIWAVVEYEEDGATLVAGFKDGSKLGHGPATPVIHAQISSTTLSSVLERDQEVAEPPLVPVVPAVIDAAARGDEGEVQRLIDGGSDVSTVDLEGNTALHVAAQHGHHGVAALLVASGMNVDAKNAAGSTALHEAAAMGDYETAKLLIESGAAVAAATVDGYTPLHFAAEMRNFEMAQITRSMGVQSNYEWKEDNVRVAGLLIDNGAALDAREGRGETPLHRTTPWNNYPVAKLLIDRGAHPSVQDNEGMTAYDHAKRNGAKDVARLLKKLTVAK